MKSRLFLAAYLVARLAAAEDRPLTVDAAASLVDVLPRVAEAWKGQGGAEVHFNFDATSRLAAQVKAGAPVDAFFSADVEWMDDLAKAGRVDASTRVDLLGNELVLVAPDGAPIASLDDLKGPKVKHVALAAENVPAGRYARAALRQLGLWDAVAAKVVNASNVRQALSYAAGGEVDAALVYRSDALAEPKVKVLATVPEESHPPIVYPAAVLVGAAPSAKAFLAFCRGASAKKLFESAGFRVLARPD